MEVRKDEGNRKQGVLPYALAIAILVFIAYANTFHVPFIFDDSNIIDNSSIRHLTSFFQVFNPPADTGIAGRPLINFSLALNYAISGMDPWSYHLLNLLIHLSAALCLFGILRRSFLSARWKESYGDAATPLAFTCALIWALHPLQTQAVTYTIQRCESLMGLCFLLTFYCAIRGWQAVNPRPWHLAAILSFLWGVGTKEVIVVAPFLLFVYDAMFFHGSPRDVLLRSSLLYTGLSCGLVTLGLLVAQGGTAALSTGGIIIFPVDYWITQPAVILHYLRLAFWPDRLCIDYGWPLAKLGNAWPAIVVLTTLIVASLWALGKKMPLGFPALWFFAILAPTSLVPLQDAAFEHRMYLPLVAPVVIMVAGVYRLLNVLLARWITTTAGRSMILRKGARYLLILVGLSLGTMTYARNMDYQNAVSIWADAVEKYPENSRAHLNLGVALQGQGEYESAIYHYAEAIRLKPNYTLARTNLGNALMSQGKIDEAIAYFRQFLNTRPNNAAAQRGLAEALLRKGKYDESISLYNQLLRGAPDDAELFNNLGVALAAQKNIKLAVRHFESALRINPDYAEARNNLSIVIRNLNTAR